MEQTIQCKICKEPYKVYSHYAGDQSACPDCIAKANRKRTDHFNRSRQEDIRKYGYGR